mgnify:CR=1 FL=1
MASLLVFAVWDSHRLLALGCRFEAAGDARSVEVLFADPDTGTVIVLSEFPTCFAAGDLA